MLSYSPDQIQAPYGAIYSAEMPPCVPMHDGDPRLNQYIPWIAASMANEMTQGLQQGANALRIYQYNQMGRNSFNNDDFHQLVNTTAKYFGMLLGTNQLPWQQLDQMMPSVITRFVELARASNIKAEPMLQQYIDQQMFHAVLGLANAFDEILNQVRMFWAQVRQRSGGYPAVPGMPGMPGVVASGYNPAMGGATNAMQGYINQQITQAPGQSALFHNGGNPGTMISNGQQRQLSGRTYSDKGTRAMPEMPKGSNISPNTGLDMTPPVDTGTDGTTQQPMLEKTIAKRWRRSDKFPFRPVYNPRTHGLTLMDLGKGIIEPVLTEKESFDMDFAQHEPSLAFGVPPVNLAKRQDINAAAKISTGIRKMNEAVEQSLEEPVEGAKLDYKSVVYPELIIENTLDEAWYMLARYRLRAAVDGMVPTVYRLFGIVSEVFFSTTDNNEMIETFSNAATYADLVTDMNNEYEKAMLDVWSLAHDRITQAVNRFLAQDMGLTNLSIDSFTVDYDELEDHISKKYGKKLLDVFLKGQRNVIRATFSYFEDRDHIDASWIDKEMFEDTGIEPKITHIPYYVSLTYLNVTSYELEINLDVGVGMTVEESLTPNMRFMLENLFVDVENREKNGNVKFARHLFRTTDGKTIEARRGAINNDHMVLTLLK